LPGIALWCLLSGCNLKGTLTVLVDTEQGEDGGDGGGPGGETASSDACDDAPGQILCDGSLAITCDEVGDVLSADECADDPAAVCVEDLGCAPCTPALEVRFADGASPAGLYRVEGVDEASFGWLRYRMRPVTIDGEGDLPGVYTLDVDEGLSLYSEGGLPVVDGYTIRPGELPVTVLAAGSGWGEWRLRARYVHPEDDGQRCEEDRVEVYLRALPRAPMAGRALPHWPGFSGARVFNQGAGLELGLDPAAHAERVGLEYDAWLVPHRDPEAWADDPDLADAGGAPERAAVGGDTLAAAIFELEGGELDLTDRRGAGFDVVLDFGLDGQLDPGDLLDGPGDDAAALYVVGDLGEAGPHESRGALYSGGRWLGQKLYYPADIRELEPQPLVVISHGNGHDFRWYDYLGEHLSSWGFVVMAHENNTGPGIETASQTTLENTDWFLSNLDSVEGGALLDRVDGARIAWIGHSRGGEGVVRAFDRLIEGDFVPAAFDEADVAVISSIAPTIFLGVEDSDPHYVGYHLIAGAADGDVHGAPDCEQCQFFRLTSAAEGTTRTNYLHGVGHNEFNCCGVDDATGPDLVGREATQALAKRYFLALVELHLRDRVWLADYFSRMYDDLAMLGAPPEITMVNAYRTARAGADRVLDDYQSFSDLEIGAAGGAVALDVGSPEEELMVDGDDRLSWSEADPMNGMTQGEWEDATDRGLVFDWAEGEERSVELALPAGFDDLRDYTWLSFRAAQGTRHPETVALDGPLAFSVALRDRAGVEVGLRFDSFGVITRPYQRTGEGDGAGWSNEFSTVRLRLADFVADGSGLDLGALEALRFEFGGEAGPRGRVALDDIEFTRD